MIKQTLKLVVSVVSALNNGNALCLIKTAEKIYIQITHFRKAANKKDYNTLMFGVDVMCGKIYATHTHT